MDKKYQKVKVSPLPKSEVEITAEIPVSILNAGRPKALKHINEHLDLPGFRKGHVPEKIILEKIGEMGVLEETARGLLSEIVYNIFVEEKIRAIGEPHITITKITPGEPVEFKVKTAVLPELILPDYKNLAKKENSKNVPKITVEDKEVEEVIKELQKTKAEHSKLREKSDTPANTTETKDDTLPEVDEIFIKLFGDFKSVDEFKTRIKENLTREKEQKEKEKRRGILLDAIISNTTIDVPQLLVENELNRMWAQFNDDIARMGIKADEYLKHLKKTEEELRKEWQTDAEKRAKLQLVLAKIASEEKIFPTKEEIEHETKHLLEHYKDAKPERARAYIETMLTNEKVILFLESQR